MLPGPWSLQFNYPNMLRWWSTSTPLIHRIIKFVTIRPLALPEAKFFPKQKLNNRNMACHLPLFDSQLQNIRLRIGFLEWGKTEIPVRSNITLASNLSRSICALWKSLRAGSVLLESQIERNGMCSQLVDALSNEPTV